MSEYDLLGFEEESDLANEELKIKSIQQDGDLKSVMSTPQGRRVLWRIMGTAGLVTPSFSAENSHLTDFNEGKRSVGIAICKWIHKVDVSSFSKMQMESIALEKQVLAERKARAKKNK